MKTDNIICTKLMARQYSCKYIGAVNNIVWKRVNRQLPP